MPKLDAFLKIETQNILWDFGLVWLGWVYLAYCRLFNAKFSLYLYIRYQATPRKFRSVCHYTLYSGKSCWWRQEWHCHLGYRNCGITLILNYRRREWRWNQLHLVHLERSPKSLERSKKSWKSVDKSRTSKLKHYWDRP